MRADDDDFQVVKGEYDRSKKTKSDLQTEVRRNEIEDKCSGIVWRRSACIISEALDLYVLVATLHKEMS